MAFPGLCISAANEMGHCALIGAGHFGVFFAGKKPFLCPAESFVGNKRQIPGNNPAF